MSKAFLTSKSHSADAVSVAALSRQVAAIPLRSEAGQPRILMVTTRKSRKWIVPKGWHIPGLAGFEAAAREAFEEAGVRGIVSQRPIGQYDYIKTREPRPDLTCRVDVYLLHVNEELPVWPEMTRRDREWVNLDEAVARAGHAGLGTLIAKNPDIFTAIVCG